MPGDPTQKIWVWLEALSNYINALGYGENSKKFQEWWQKNDNKIHIIGKGIARFHAVYWPALLLSAGLKLPKTIFVHGYLTSNGQKMSKSLGNVIDPFGLVNKYGTDAVRYFLLREIPPTEDGDFTYKKFEGRYNSDLASGLGNLVARVIKLAKISNFQFPISKSRFHRGSSTKSGQIPNSKFKTIINKTWKDYHKALKEFKFNEALISIWSLISFCDKYIEKEKPWSFDPVQDKQKQKEVIGDLALAIGEISKLLQPFLPETSEDIKKQIKTRKGQSLFPRIC